MTLSELTYIQLEYIPNVLFNDNVTRAQITVGTNDAVKWSTRMTGLSKTWTVCIEDLSCSIMYGNKSHIVKEIKLRFIKTINNVHCIEMLINGSLFYNFKTYNNADTKFFFNKYQGMNVSNISNVAVTMISVNNNPIRVADMCLGKIDFLARNPACYYEDIFSSLGSVVDNVRMPYTELNFKNEAHDIWYIGNQYYRVIEGTIKICYVNKKVNYLEIVINNEVRLIINLTEPLDPNFTIHLDQATKHDTRPNTYTIDIIPKLVDDIDLNSVFCEKVEDPKLVPDIDQLNDLVSDELIKQYEKITESTVEKEDRDKVYTYMMEYAKKYIDDNNNSNFCEKIEGLKSAINISATEIHKKISKEKMSEYQVMLYSQAEIYGQALTKEKDVSNIISFYNNFRDIVNGSFKYDDAKKVLQMVQKPIKKYVQQECIIAIQNANFSRHEHLNIFLRNLSIEEASHPLLDEMLNKIEKKHKAYRIILGVGSIEEKSIGLYNYLLGAIKMNVCRKFNSESDLQTWYKSCVDRYPF